MEKTVTKQRKRAAAYFDYSLLAAVIFLVCFGLVMLYSTSSYSAQIETGDDMSLFKKQALISAASVAVMLVVSKINYHWYAKWAKYLYFFSIFLMALVLTPLGIEAYGARRWLRLPAGFQLQPSELAKIAVILFIPLLICNLGKKVKTTYGFWKVCVWGGINAAAVFCFTDNLSTAIIVMGITCVMLTVVYPKIRKYMLIGGGAIAAVIILLQIFGSKLESFGGFRLGRVLVWLNPEAHASEGGFQIMQGLYAIGAGGLFGKGLGNSTQKMVIPEVQNDMILAIICEELGIFGAVLLLVLFGFLLYRLLFIAQNAPDMYGSLIVTGIFAHIALQVVLNIAVVTNLIPTTGITLPFVSYGGTSIVFLMSEMGIALGISGTIRLE
ncbi:FtsW/RodA/SpoVE family cell cycle protein [Lachnoclostridium sp. An181]|uniref:FtsW/RodA/SpoVE family cell cycle protein n=1 Tax=Lachnoclostridium sp. An181 TaxID=1965575 RepID=UPI000B384D2C|nr:putative peptidoglycan glycosyltransferase FtsW [Lachnoclostridium sp. An181]OUP50728.1 cell division protein [Lachnoclostridium sp. An181]